MVGRPGLISIRSGSGLGDAIYLQSIARHFIESGREVEVCTRYPEVFYPLSGRVRVSDFRRDRITHLAHYADRRDKPGTTQFEDCCIRAGVNSRVDLRLDWKPANAALVEEVRRLRRPLIAVQLMRAPFGDRPDRYGIELLPQVSALQAAIDAVADQATVIQIGAGKALSAFTGIAHDFAGRTSVADLLDICSVVDGFLGYVSFMVPMAEALRKPALMVWSRRGLESRDKLIRTITPTKVFHGQFCEAVVDDCGAGELQKATDAFCRRIARPLAA